MYYSPCVNDNQNPFNIHIFKNTQIRGVREQYISSATFNEILNGIVDPAFFVFGLNRQSCRIDKNLFYCVFNHRFINSIQDFFA